MRRFSAHFQVFGIKIKHFSQIHCAKTQTVEQAGVAPDVTLRGHMKSKTGDNQWPHKMDLVLTKLKKSLCGCEDVDSLTFELRHSRTFQNLGKADLTIVRRCSVSKCNIN